MRRHASLFAGLLVVVAVATGTSAGVAGFLSSAASEGVRAVLEALPGSDLSLGIAMRREPDAAEQERVATSTIRATFRDGDRTIPIGIESTVETVLPVDTPRSRSSGGGTTPRVAIATASHLHSDAELVSGRWGAGAGEATLQADAAAALGANLGDTLSIGDTELVLVGTWRVADAGGARWMADERWLIGVSGATYGPLIIDPSAWNSIDDVPWVQWVIVPDPARLRATDLAAIEAAWERTPDALTAAGLLPGGRSSALLGSTHELRARLAALQTALPLTLVILAAIAALTVWELAGLSARIRASETSLLWSRGATAASLSRRASAEAIAVTAIGSAVGVGAASFALWSTRGTDAAASVLSAGAWAATAAIVASGAAFAVRTSRTANAGAAAERVGRRRRFAGAGAVVLLLIAAALSTWQLQLYGPVTRTAAGDVSVDPLTVIAPALILASVVLLGLYAFPVLAGAAERAALRRNGPALAVRGVARRIGAAAATIVLVGLAVGQLTFASGYGATWSESSARAQALQSGTALRIEGTTLGVGDADVDRVRSTPGVTGVAPVRTASLTVGGEQTDLVGVASSAVAALAQRAGGLVEPSSLADAMAPTTTLPLLPDGAASVTVDVGASPATPAAIWLSDAWGRLQRLGLTAVAGRTGLSAAELPAEGRPPWRVAGIDLAPTVAENTASIAIDAVRTDVGDVTPVPSIRVAFDGTGEQLSRADVDAGAVPRGAGAILRMLPTAGTDPIVMSEWLATRTRAEVGSAITLSLSPTAPPLTTVVAAIVPAIPGSQGSAGILIDASVIDAVRLRSSAAPAAAATVWVGSSDAAATARALRDVLPASIGVRELGAEPDQVMLGAGATSLWIAVIAGAVLAIAGLIVVCAAQQRERHRELGILRALGFSPADQAGVRRGELTLITGWAAVCGLAAGGAALLVVAKLARAAIPNAYRGIPTVTRVDPFAGGVALLAFAAAVAIVIALAGLAVARAAGSARIGGADL